MQRSTSVSKAVLKATSSISSVSLRPLALFHGRPSGRLGAFDLPQCRRKSSQLRRHQHRVGASQIEEKSENSLLASSFASALPHQCRGDDLPESVETIAEIESGGNMLRIRWEDGLETEWYVHVQAWTDYTG